MTINFGFQMQSRYGRPKCPVPSKFTEPPKFYLRLWYTQTNSYSETIHVNNAMLYRHSMESKHNLRKGSVISVRVNNEDINGVVLCRGTFEEMEALEPQLERFAEERYDTTDVLSKLEVGNENLHDEHSDPVVEPLEPIDIVKEKKRIRLLKGVKVSRKSQDRLEHDFTCKPNTSFAIEEKQNPTVREGNISSDSTSSKSFHLKRKYKPNSVFMDGERSDDSRSTSNLILAELRVQTTLLRSFDVRMRENNQLLHAIRGDEVELPKTDSVFEGIGGPFRLSSLCTANPSVFAREFLRKMYTLEDLSNKILCPKGKSIRKAFTDAEVAILHDALKSWFGEHYNWLMVRSSINQFIRDIKTERPVSN